MPLAVVSTNIIKGNIPRDFMKRLSDVLEDAFDCNQALCMVEVRPGAMLMRAGTTEPLVNAEVHHSYDKITDTTKREVGKLLADFFIEQLNVSLERILVLFFDTRCTTKPKVIESKEQKQTTSL